MNPGDTLGQYRVLDKLGAGGMGEVYRARDATLNRDVALKVLLDAVVSDAQRLARFKREAHVLASLNHPHIAHLYGFEEGPPTSFLVMELVEGPTLADLIAAAPGGLPLDQALSIALQIADALEAAHEQGVVHRDLKPANVKVRDDGVVKVLDFGLAKAVDPVSSSGAEATNSPTMTGRATQLGMILGTAAYMAPEQAKGKAVDKRADIWAFGVVLYEMLTGRRLFEAEDISETLAAVLRQEITLSVLPATTPPRLARLVGRCLERDPKQRLRDIGEARLLIDKVIAGAPEDVVASATAEPASVPRWRRALPWALSGVTGAALLAALLAWAPWRAAPPPALLRLSVDIGADASLTSDLGAAAILSPDGQTLAFVAQKGGVSKVYVRHLNELQGTPLKGTEGAGGPFFSPDGQQLGFFANLKLKKVPVAGGAAVDLSPAAFGRGGTWADDDTIIFTQGTGHGSRLMRVSSDPGGTAQPFSTLSPGATTQRWPQVIAGRVVLYTEHSNVTDFDSANLVVAPLAGGAPKTVLHGGYYGRYLPTGLASPTRSERDGGHLIYVEQGTLYAVPFDLDRLERVGRAVPVLDGLATNPANAGAQVAFSATGTLVYLPGASRSRLNPIDWMTRDGKTAPLRAKPADWAGLRFSPDRLKLAFSISDGRQSDIFTYEWTHDRLTPLALDPGEDVWPVWTHDGLGIAFASDRAKPGTPNIYYVNADGTGDVTRLTDSPENQIPTSWNRDGTVLAFSQGKGGNRDMMMLTPKRDATGRPAPGGPTALLGAAAERGSLPVFSPDGHFIAYTKVEQDTYQVYVRPFPGPGGPWRITQQDVGGVFPRWSEDTKEILFLGKDKVMVVRYTVVGDSFRGETAQPWSPTGYVWPGRSPTSAPFDVHPDGKRVALLAARPEADVVNDKVVFLFNFFDELRRVAPATKK